jgi:2-methylcitrate dehydratase PrpD
MHPGWAAHCGIAAATMAKHGFTGPASIVEGRFGLFRSHLFGQEKALDFSVATDGLGAAWMQLDSSFKPYPCAHAIHSFVDAALRLHREHRLASADIERVEVVVAEHFVGLSCEPRDVKIRPATPTHARASLFYAVAASLCHGRLGVEAYADDAIGDSAVLDLAARSTWIADPTAPDLSRYRGWVRLYMRDGRQYEAVEETNRGSRDNPLSDDALIEKIRGNVGALLPADRTQALVSAVMGLETLDSVARLIDLCVSPQLAARST